MPTFLYEKFHMTLTAAGFSAVAFIQLSSALSAPVHGWLADWLSSKRCNGRVLAQLLNLVMGSIAIVSIGRATTKTSLIIAMIAFGICKGGYDIGMFASLFDHIAPPVKGSAVGLMNAFGWTGGSLGVLVLGAIATYGGTSASAMERMSITISASAGAYILGAILLASLLFITRKKASPRISY
jgi:MFS family permease